MSLGIGKIDNVENLIFPFGNGFWPTNGQFIVKFNDKHDFLVGISQKYVFFLIGFLGVLGLRRP